jgi:hypothetical protein
MNTGWTCEASARTVGTGPDSRREIGIVPIDGKERHKISGWLESRFRDGENPIHRTPDESLVEKASVVRLSVATDSGAGTLASDDVRTTERQYRTDHHRRDDEQRVERSTPVTSRSGRFEVRFEAEAE